MSDPTPHSRPSLPPAPAVASAPLRYAAATDPTSNSEALKLLQLDVERLIDAYEIDVMCHSCRHVYPRAIAWLRTQSSMECEHCQATIVLRTSVMNEEMRRVGRQLRKLQTQLAEMIERAVGILGQ
jgi:hypothetical protein